MRLHVCMSYRFSCMRASVFVKVPMLALVHMLCCFEIQASACVCVRARARVCACICAAVHARNSHCCAGGAAVVKAVLCKT